ncbi:MAG: YbfB/YjiJ family MFS transporter [Vulcanimicrobiaceae bacterium]
MWTKVAWAAACFAAIMGFSRLAYGVLVPAMRASLGGTYALYGAIGAANLAGYLVGTLLATRLARRTDRSRVNAIALAIMCVAMAASGMVHGTELLGALRFLVGIGSGVGVSLTLALAVEAIPPARRGIAAAFVWAGGSLGIALVGVAGVAPFAAAPDAWRVQWVAMGALGLASAAAFFAVTHGRCIVRDDVPDDGSGIGLLRRDGYLPLTLGYFAYGVGYIDVVTFMGAAIGGSHAVPPAASWIVLGTAGVAGATLWGKLVDRYRNGVPVGVACACSALGAAGLASGSTALVLLGALLVGASFIGVPAMVGALLQQRESNVRYGRAFASMTVVLGIAQIVGPVFGGIVADRAGARAALWVGAAMLALAAASAARYRRMAPAAVASALNFR